MANRFYIPRRRSFVDLAQLGLQLYGVQQRGKQAKATQDIEREKLKLTKDERAAQARVRKIEYGHIEPARHTGALEQRPGAPAPGIDIPREIPGLRQRAQDLKEEQFLLAKSTSEVKSIAEQPITTKQWVTMRSKMNTEEENSGTDWLKIIEPEINWAKNHYESAPKYDIYRGLQQKFVTNKARIEEDFQKRINKADLAEEEAQSDFLSTRLQELSSGAWLNNIMPVCKMYGDVEKQTMEIEGDIAQARLVSAQRGPEGRIMKTWITQDNNIITIPNNEQPPPGSVPYSSGMDVEVGPEGGISIRTGVSRRGGQAGMTRTTQTALEKGVLDTSAGIARLEEISRSYKPEYLELGTKWKTFTTKWKEKLRGTPIENWVNLGVSERDRQLLADFSAFKRDALDNINRYIKEITGAQMSEKEADRLRQAAPDPGEGLFDGDSPTQFQSNWGSSIKSLKISQARFMYLKNAGMTPQSIQAMASNDTLPSLQQIKSIMEQRDEELEQEIRNSDPSLTEEEIDRAVSQALKQEFGI